MVIKGAFEKNPVDNPVETVESYRNTFVNRNSLVRKGVDMSIAANFISAVEPKRFDDFVKNHPLKSHFMQSVGWGEFNRVERGMEPHYIGMEDSRGELVAAAMLLMRKPPVFPPYFYAPRGFVIDFFDRELLGVFTESAVKYCREYGGMFLKIDPDIELREIDGNGSPVPGGFDNMALVDTLLELGFRHRGFNLGFDNSQPRFTFRIDLFDDEAKIKKGISGTVLKNVRKGENYSTGLEVGDSGEVKELFRLISETGERDDFYPYGESYYQNFYDILQKYDMATLYIGKTYPRKTQKKLECQLAETEARARTLKKDSLIQEAEITAERLRREISLFSEYAEKYGETAVTNAHLVVHYGEHAWAVHAGSSGAMKETFLNNRLYLYKILDQKQKGAVWIDQFGTVGNPEDSHLKSLHEFKRQFGGRYIEFIGEFDYSLKPIWHFLYDKAMPGYRSFRLDLRALLRRMEKKRRRRTE